MNSSPTKFGLPFYQVPLTGLARTKYPQWKFGSDKRKNFVDIAKKYEFVPGPGKYEHGSEWK